MTRRDQYELFYKRYEAEEKRYEYLNQRATFYVGFLSAFSLFAGLSGDKLSQAVPRSAVGILLSAFSCSLLLLAILFSVLSMRPQDYKDVCDVEDIIVEIDENDYSDEDTYSILLVNLADAVKHNRRVNDKRAAWLARAGISLASALSLFILLAIINAVLKH